MRDMLLAMRADAVVRSLNNWHASFGEPSPVRGRRSDAHSCPAFFFFRIKY